ncbi:MAG: helix-turn-helix domain-containing protein [Candidatus Ornithomonoglobus sp.]
MEERYITEEYIDRAIDGDTKTILMVLNHYDELLQRKASRQVWGKKGREYVYCDKDFKSQMKIKIVTEISHFAE